MSEERPTHAQIYEALARVDERLNAGSDRFVDIDKKLDDIVEALKPLPKMQEDIAATKEIVEAWGAIKTAGKFITWFAKVMTALAVIGATAVASIKFAIHIGK